MMNIRIKNLIDTFQKYKIDSLLVTKDINIKYLTNFPACESWLLVSPQKIFYITDFRYILEAKKGLKGVDVIRYMKSKYDTLFNLTLKKKLRRIGFDERQITLAEYKILKSYCPKTIQLVPANDIIEKFRVIKDKTELNKIKSALEIHGLAHNLLKKIIKPNITERDVFDKLDRFVKTKGVGFSFNPIIASGVNSCYPHAHVTDRKIRNNEIVLTDMGIDAHGYKSDLTRMIFLGKISSFIMRVHDLVHESQQRAIRKIKEGVLISEVDAAARKYLEKQRLAKFFGHSLGHGVGLEIHESPGVSQHNSSILKEGMVITIEPAVYIPNKFGIRLEDMVYVTKNGCEVLSDNIH